MKKHLPLVIFIIALLLVGYVLFNSSAGKNGVSSGTTTVMDETELEILDGPRPTIASTRQVFVTEAVTLPVRNVGPTADVKHSIAIADIFGGGPPKDGIPSIDNPQFETVTAAREYLDDEAIGLGIKVGDETRFYPYLILVRHELVNDSIQGVPVLVSYCPLCFTGVVFDRRVGENVFEFGVSGMLWESNVLMYNRAEDQVDESLWSQVLGEAVLGDHTGTKLSIVPSDVARFGDWITAHPDTLVLSRDTGVYPEGLYQGDPYIQRGYDYYTSPDIWFGSFGGGNFTDDRLGPKDIVLGVEIDGQFRAYAIDDLPEGTTIDAYAGRMITIEKDEFGSVRIFVGENREPLQYISGFWFSWIGAHPDTTLFSNQN